MLKNFYRHRLKIIYRSQNNLEKSVVMAIDPRLQFWVWSYVCEGIHELVKPQLVVSLGGDYLLLCPSLSWLSLAYQKTIPSFSPQSIWITFLFLVFVFFQRPYLKLCWNVMIVYPAFISCDNYRNLFGIPWMNVYKHIFALLDADCWCSVVRLWGPRV